MPARSDASRLLRDMGPFRGDAHLAVEAAWPLFRQGVRRTARRLSAAPDDQDDLEQEAFIELWRCDPTRYDLTRKDDVDYVARLLSNRMWHAWGEKDFRSRAQSSIAELSSSLPRAGG